MASKLKIDQAKCIKCGTCVALFPEIFEFADDGSVVVKDGVEVDDSKVDEVCGCCPQEAISKF